jgi:hypothetical protein
MCLQINKHVLRCARQGVELTDLESLVEQVTQGRSVHQHEHRQGVRCLLHRLLQKQSERRAPRPTGQGQLLKFTKPTPVLCCLGKARHHGLVVTGAVCVCVCVCRAYVAYNVFRKAWGSGTSLSAPGGPTSGLTEPCGRVPAACTSAHAIQYHICWADLYTVCASTQRARSAVCEALPGGSKG